MREWGGKERVGEEGGSEGEIEGRKGSKGEMVGGREGENKDGLSEQFSISVAHSI